MEWQIRLFASVNSQDLKWCSKMRDGPANFESITYSSGVMWTSFFHDYETMAAFMQLVRIQERHNLHRERIFRDSTHPLDTYTDEEIRCRYRLSREMIMNLHNMIADDLEPHTQRNHAIPAINHILCALLYYATRSCQSVVGDSFGVHRSTVSRIIARVTSAICRYRHNYIQFPATQNEINAMEQESTT